LQQPHWCVGAKEIDNFRVLPTQAPDSFEDRQVGLPRTVLFETLSSRCTDRPIDSDTPRELIYQRSLADTGFSSNKQDLPFSRKHLIETGSYPGQGFVPAHHSLRWDRAIQAWRLYRRGCPLPGLCNRSDEPIASTMCGFNEPGLPWIVAKGFPELANNDLQNAVTNKSAWPDGFVEFLFCNKVTGMTNQVVEQPERLGPERYRL
jgi:hypothetical protein